MSPPENTDRTRWLLLVEDNPGDADLVRELLEEGTEGMKSTGPVDRLVQASSLAGALQLLQRQPVDAVLLDLRLPDCSGLDTVRRLRAEHDRVPVVVLTGCEEDELALACIAAGAQDYLAKAELTGHGLRRALGYATARVHEAQLRELQRQLSGYRLLSSATQSTSVTAALAGSGAVAARQPGAFAHCVGGYVGLLEPYLVRTTRVAEPPREVMEAVVTVLGDASGGPRDLMDVHVAALDQVTATFANLPQSALVLEARLLALQMMGLLVDYYRVGLRRRL